MAKLNLIITTPKGLTMKTSAKALQMRMTFEIDKNFGAKYTKRFTKAQKFIDGEVLRFCSTRVPFQTGMLQKSGTIGTELGKGEIRYIAPYAAPQYYNTSQSRPYDDKRGAYWFERGKVAERKRILQSAAKLLEADNE